MVFALIVVTFFHCYLLWWITKSPKSIGMYVAYILVHTFHKNIFILLSYAKMQMII